MIGRALSVVILAIGGALPAWADGIVRAGTHPGYGRIVLEWSKPVAVTATQDGDRLRLVFAEPFEGSLTEIARRLPDYVASADLAADKLSASVVLKRPVSLKNAASGARAIFDLVPVAQSAAASEKLPPEARTPPTELRPEAGARGPAAPLSVLVRWGAHPTFDRIVVEGAAEARVAREGDTLIVTLPDHGEPAVSGFKAGALRHVRTLEARGATLRATLAPGASVETKRMGSKLVLDIGVGLTTQEAIGLARLAPAAGPEVKPAAPEPKPATPADAKAAPQSLVAGAPAATTPASPPLSSSAPKLEAPKAETPKAEPAPKPVSGKTAREAASAEAEGVPAMSSFFAARERDSVVVRAATEGGAAVFHRAGALWLVFGTMPPADMQGLEKSLKGIAGAPVRVSGVRGGAVRIAGADAIHPHVRRDQGVWIVELSKNRPPPPRPILAEPQLRATEGVALLASTGISGVVELKDPEVGDRLFVALAAEPELGHPTERELPEIHLLSSPLGLAMVALADGVVATRGPEGLVLAGVRTGPDAASGPVQPAIAIAAVVTNERRVFDFAAWRRPNLGDTVEGTKALRKTAALARPERRNDARLDLAHFFFARGLPHDALAVVQTAVREAPALAENLDIRAFRGALRLLANDLDGARQDLASPGLDASREAALWRGLLAHRTGEAATAARGFAHGVSLLPDYPAPYKATLALAAAEAALDDGAPGQASAYLDTLKRDALSPAEKASQQLFRARILAGSERAEEGLKQLGRLRRSADPKNVARAALAQVEAGLAQGKLPRDEAIAELEAARFAWRGDGVEFAILRRLAALRLEEGHVRKGLATLRMAITHFPQHRETPALARDMQDAFARAFLNGAADAMPLVSALALYSDFSELAPGGEAGDAIVSRLAQRLVGLDLLDQAASLLERKLQGRTAGEARARMGAQLAEIRLLDEKPQAALRAIEVSAGGELPANLAQHRSELRARALSGMGRHDEAAGLLKADIPAEAELRAELLWKARQWAGVSTLCRTTLGAVMPAEGRLVEADERRVMRCAVASALANDEVSLAPIRAKFGSAMEKGPHKDAFLAVAAKPNAADLMVLAQQLGEMKPFKALALGSGKASN